ncbi:hypothetical protein C7N43_07455 [Sphingobacteriales bacterium UPWRP_1]|nr:hypothetical protein B6N25_05300 [Sphingobacteriales bacterium TSM_CSS]PSJ77708.1 hypothetical protein C7N43_07455 [Sphingobacteriales bacterium UPWRP_1]
MNTPATNLFFVARNTVFPEGALFELVNQLYLPDGKNFRSAETEEEKRQPDAGYLFPDLGKGEPGLMPAADLLPCPPFAENLPPGKGALQVTRLGIVYDQPLKKPAVNAPIIAYSEILVHETLHWQRLGLPAAQLPVITHIEVFDKLRQTETEDYLYPAITRHNDIDYYCAEMSHIHFGFYRLRFFTEEGYSYYADVIKHFPASVKQKYDALLLEDDNPSRASLPNALRFSEFGYELPAAGKEVKMPGTEPVSISELAQFIAARKPGTQPDAENAVQILNLSLALTTEWGENFGKPIEERLRRRHPEIDSSLCQQLQQYANEAAYYIYEQAAQVVLHNLSEASARQNALQKYPWLNNENLSRLLNIGFYYAIR